MRSWLLLSHTVKVVNKVRSHEEETKLKLALFIGSLVIIKTLEINWRSNDHLSLRYNAQSQDKYINDSLT